MSLGHIKELLTSRRTSVIFTRCRMKLQSLAALKSWMRWPPIFHHKIVTEKRRWGCGKDHLKKRKRIWSYLEMLGLLTLRIWCTDWSLGASECLWESCKELGSLSSSLKLMIVARFFFPLLLRTFSASKLKLFEENKKKAEKTAVCF